MLDRQSGLTIEQSAALVAIESKTVYTFNDYQIARDFADTVTESVLSSPEFGVYQVIETELIVKQ